MPSAPQKKPLDERLADEARFIKTWLENPVGTGAVSPSGRFLARAMARRTGHRACFGAEVSPPVWLNLPPARVWIYRAAETPAIIRARDGTKVRLELAARPDPRGDEMRDRLRLVIRLKARKARDEFR